MSNESENRIDLTQFEKVLEDAQHYVGNWFRGTVLPKGATWRDTKDLGLHVDWSHEYVFGPLLEEVPDLIAELKRCYYLIAKMQESIVKTIGECWVCGDYIDSCDSNTCERQILEDIELGTASE